MSLSKVTYGSEEEERRWNALSELMTRFHQWFKDEYKVMYKSANGSFENRGLSLLGYLDTVSAFSAELTTSHHGGKTSIHGGIEDLTQRVEKWRKDPTSYSYDEMKSCLDSLSGVLFTHLDQEVEDIRGDQLKPYFTIEEIENIGKGHRNDI
ncbi:hypothetical protein Hypma_007882 [Hypsizygus marmoreus]|uniref:Hemerythrin-like domain-containing protein n=1 Tax=Hypsizygus marmoreus TaxID=39966 RepID=A0A369K0D5_HYPMA|nr:hypothetical protein Hypma_007882 [Hypsizygus marmoreus]